MIRLVRCAAACTVTLLALAFNVAQAEERQPKTRFDFDVAAIPPRPEGETVVARVFQRYITLADVNAKSLPLNAESTSELQGQILGELLQWLTKKEKLQASPEEVQTFYRVVLNRELSVEELRADLAANLKTSVGAHFVMVWKISRCLYERYGGEVIFQQGNPREPVGAYRRFLIEAAQAKVFEIYDDTTREAFWDYFRRDHPGLVPPEEVNYVKPWWLQEPGK
jgi:hypothetical protein